MYDWLLNTLCSIGGPFNDSTDSRSVQLECERPTVKITGRQKSATDETIRLTANGNPLPGEYYWKIVTSEIDTHCAPDGRHLDISAKHPGRVNVQVIYVCNGQSGEAYHTVEFIVRPTVKITGKKIAYFDEQVELKAIGNPKPAERYQWSPQALPGSNFTTRGEYLDVSVKRPGKINIVVNYVHSDVTSAPDSHSIEFIAYPIYIIGGGCAGLKAAEVMLKQGYRVILCEASDRLGGRAFTQTFKNNKFNVDLGCQWLHGYAWAQEAEDLNIFDSTHYKPDEQRSQYLQLHNICPYPEIVNAVLSDIGQIIKERDETFNTSPAVHFNAPLTSPQKSEIEKNVNAKIAHAANSKIIESKDEINGRIDEEMSDHELMEKIIAGWEAKAENLARTSYRPVDVKTPKARMEAFDKLQPEIKNPLIDEKKDTAISQMKKNWREKRLNELTAQYAELQKQKIAKEIPIFLDNLISLAFQIKTQAEGPLEESAEFQDFCTIDRDEDRADLGGLEEHDNDGLNAWSLVGYGGLITAYSEYLQNTYPKLFTVHINTAINTIDYSNYPPKVDGEKASAVIVTASTGVIGSGKLKFIGPKCDTLLDNYQKLPMGNYKKIAILFDQDVKAPKSPESDETYQSCGSSVYWHWQEGRGLWKFLVPDADRKIVIAIVGGKLADELDNQNAQQLTLATLQEAGIIDNLITVDDYLVSNWKNEKFILGAYSYTAVGGAGARAALIQQPLQQYQVLLAGEALYAKYGTAHGAFISGRRAAEKALTELNNLGVTPESTLIQL